MSIEYFDYRDQVVFGDEKAQKVVLTEGAHARTTLWCLQPGQHIHPHVHAGDHVWVVLEGSGEFLSNEGARIAVTPGTILSAPAGLSHGIENTGVTGLVFASISAG